ncbi:TetR/AcrR family transcriptional regulator [Streptacidiphilus fuscans]|uniref:TetR/AcrR family transcriptional regulator n=1 Tax=Streptacidiphilus fuscans TaxID=2789292 RepID=A0A931B5G0_9ACTN|nr:TetR/AcrR family transcriptional regulator [Streptacidiphilus fuscans]MBF9069346.1 TetR/AcrR family transcriptional regulator [Streptacidiphilus fuscans]
MAETRPLRADARRNRAKVLAAANEVFAAEGLAVPLDEIARRAGVGAGTVYRHFPTKEALFEAVVTDRIESLTAVGRDELASADVSNPGSTGDAFFRFLDVMVTDAGSKMDLADALTGAGVDLQESTLAVAADLRAVLTELLGRAQSAGTVRADIDLADLHALVIGAVAAERSRAEHRGLAKQVIYDGLRVTAPRPAGS